MRTVVFGTIMLAVVFFFLHQKASKVSLLSVEASRSFVRSSAEGVAQVSSRVARKAREVASSEPASKQMISGQISDDQIQRFNRLNEKLERIWEKRRSQIYEKMNLSREQVTALDEARRDHQRDFDRLVREGMNFRNGPGVADDLIKQGKRIDDLHAEYDSYVRSVVGRSKFETLKRELAAFNKRIADRSPVQLTFASVW